MTPLMIQSSSHYRWQPQSISYEGLPTFSSVKEVNKYVNKVKYVSDGKDDWKTPQRFFKEGGDCEDYVIAKKAIIEKSNLSDDVKMVMVFDRFRLNYHMVLLVDNQILDNQLDEIVYWKDMEFRYEYLGFIR